MLIKASAVIMVHVVLCFLCFYFLFIYRKCFLAALGFHCCESFSLVVASRGYSLVAVHRFLVAMASLILVGGSRMQAQELLYLGLVAPRHVGSFWTRDRTACPLHWQADS